MSYCVNCGVKLEESLKKCPLCNTPVYHPIETKDTEHIPPYAKEKGEVGIVRKTDQVILISVFIICTAVGCGLLNLLVFQQGMWSIYVIGLCCILWIFFIPVMIYQKLPFVLMIFFDGAAVASYCAFIAYRYDGWDWYIGIALPIIGMAVLFITLIGFLYQRVSKSILFTAVTVVLGIGMFCTGIDLCIRYYLTGTIGIAWSAIVLTCSIIIAITLITIMRISRLREEVRKRMHI